MNEDESNKSLEEVERWAEAADPFDRELFAAVFGAWKRDHESPEGYVTAAELGQALPQLRKATEEIRSKIPRRTVQRFMRRQRWSALLGDLQERRHLVRQRSGAKEANRWYRSQILRALPPFLWAGLKRVSGIDAICRRIGR